MLAFALLAVSIQWNFEGGSLNRAERVSETHWRCSVDGEADQDHRNRQASWYFFRVDHAKGRELTLDIVGLPGEYNYQPNRGAITGDTPPFYSDDNETWRPVEKVEYDAVEPRLRLRLTPRSDHVWIAHVPPYTSRHLTRLMTDIDGSPYVQTASAGRSAGGREIPLLTITDRSVPDASKKVLWLLFRQHAWEAGSSWAGDGLIRFLSSSDSVAARIRRSTIVKIFPMCDPDGVARGGVRFNQNGFDLNRNWDIDDPAKMPEIDAQRRAIVQWIESCHRLDCLLTLHNTETAEYLDGPPNPSDAMRMLTERLFDHLQQTATFAATRRPEFVDTSTTPGKPGRMNVVQGMRARYGITGLLIEQRIARHPKLGRQPNIEDRRRFGAELIQALAGAL